MIPYFLLETEETRKQGMQNDTKKGRRGGVLEYFNDKYESASV